MLFHSNLPLLSSLLCTSLLYPLLLSPHSPPSLFPSSLSIPLPFHTHSLLRSPRDVVLHNGGHVGKVEPSCGDVGADEHSRLGLQPREEKEGERGLQMYACKEKEEEEAWVADERTEAILQSASHAPPG